MKYGIKLATPITLRQSIYKKEDQQKVEMQLRFRQIRYLFVVWLILSNHAYSNTDLIYTNGIQPNLIDTNLTRVILNGNEVSKGVAVARSTVKIKISRAEKDSFCSGTIISSQLILTAGHCLDGDINDLSVLFGLNDQTGYIRRSALDYRHYYTQIIPPPPINIWKDGYLSYDEQQQRLFRRRVELQTTINQKPEYINLISELGLIKIEDLPAGYSPIKFHNSEQPIIFSNHFVYAAGYGLDNRYEESKLNTRLRFSEQKITSFVPGRGGSVAGWEVYPAEESQNICLGDSGGPLFILNSLTGDWELFGITILTTNFCANSAFVLYPGYFEFVEMIESWAEEMNSTFKI